MKITYIDEGVRLPSGQTNRVSLADIQRTNETYIKQQICDIINEEFNNVTGYDNIQPSVLRRFFFGNCDSDDCTTPIDFSSAIDITRDSGYKYIVHLCTHLLDAQQDWLILYATEINHFLDDICDRHSDLISDIRLTDALDKADNFRGYYNVTHDIKNIKHLPYPTFKINYYNNGVLKTASCNLLVFMVSPSITDEQLQGLTEYMLRFDNVTSDGVECMLKSLANYGHKYRPYDVFAFLSKIINDVLPKFKFKFSKIVIDDDLGIDIARIKSSNMQQRVFDPQKMTNIAYDFDKFYVEYKFDYISKYIYSEIRVDFYTQDYSQEKRALISEMFRYISHYLEYPEHMMTRNNIGIGYYPKLDKLCFIHTDDTNLSPEDMFVPVDKVIDFIIENAVDKTWVTHDDIDDGLKKFFNIN